MLGGRPIGLGESVADRLVDLEDDPESWKHFAAHEFLEVRFLDVRLQRQPVNADDLRHVPALLRWLETNGFANAVLFIDPTIHRGVRRRPGISRASLETPP